MHLISFGILVILVTTAGPTAAEGVKRLGAIVPIATGGSGPGNQQLADLPAFHLVAGIIHQLDLISRNNTTRRSIANLVEPVGQKNMQHLRRADAIEYVHAKM